MDRRQLVMGLGISGLVGSSLFGCSKGEEQAGADEPEETGNEHEVDFLFVHSANETSLAEGVLTLRGIVPSTTYFSDRPERIAGQLSTEEFVANWGHGGEDSFEADPPNATVSILSGPAPQEIVVILRSPRLEEGALIYDVEVLEGNETAVGEASAVFIDIIGRPLTPLSIAGSRRRVRRRTRRRVERRN
jgi:hypothetical protein